VNNELERMWKEAVVTCFKVLYRHLPGGTEKNDENPLVRIAGLRRTSGCGEQINRMCLVARSCTTRVNEFDRRTSFVVTYHFVV
jgi:hypothetical protein